MQSGLPEMSGKMGIFCIKKINSLDILVRLNHNCQNKTPLQLQWPITGMLLKIFCALFLYLGQKKFWLENFTPKFFFLQRCLPVTAAEWVSPLCCLQIALSGFEPTNAWPDFDKNLILILLKFNQNFNTYWEQMNQVGHPPLLQKAISLAANQCNAWPDLSKIESNWKQVSKVDCPPFSQIHGTFCLSSNQQCITR